MSPAAFGHSGNVGSSFAFADPAGEVAVAVVFNGIVDPDSAFWRRRSLVATIYQALDDADQEGLEADTGGADEAPETTDPGRSSRWRRRRGR